MIKKTEVIVKCKNEEFSINCLNLSSLGKMLGLMFCRVEKSEILLFEFNKDVHKSIHSMFVSFDFLALWLDEDNNVIEKRIVKPWEKEVLPEKPYRKLIEIPIKLENKKLCDKIYKQQ